MLLDKIDVEAPEYLSQPVQLYIFAALSQNGDRISSNLTLPIYLRYHRPGAEGSTGFVQITLGSPDVYVHCSQAGMYDLSPFSFSSHQRVIDAYRTAETFFFNLGAIGHELNPALEFHLYSGLLFHSAIFTT